MGLRAPPPEARQSGPGRARARRIVAAMLAVIEDLDAADETAPGATHTQHPLNPVEDDATPIAETAPSTLPIAPPEWREPGSIVCIAGRGVLDDAVTAMLEQLLWKRGFGVRRVTHAEVARDRIAEIDFAGTRLVCLSYLELGGSPTHLRYLVRRLRRAAPGASVMVGLWPEGEAALTDAQIQQTLGADLYVGSLRAAVDAAAALADEPATLERQTA